MTTIASQAGIGVRPARGGMLWSEYGFPLAAAVAVVVVVDPLEWQLAADPVLKHLALMILLPSLLLTLAGWKIRRPLKPMEFTAPLMSATWPLLVLALLILGGSLYARLVLGIQSTFLNVGLYMLVTAGAAAMVLQTDAPEALVRAYSRLLLAAGVVMSAYLIVNFRTRQVYHEQIFLLIPLAALFFARDAGVMRWVAAAFFISMAWISQKYTSYLIGALTVAYLALFIAYPRLTPRSGLSRLTVVYWSCLGAIMTVVALIYAAMQGAGGLPSGNLEYRLHTYAVAWDQFMASPVWGTLFAEPAVEKFTLYSIGIAGNVLPTHSDILDLLAHGGLIAVLLWLYGLARIARIAHGNLLRSRHLAHPWAPYAHALALMSLAGIVTYAFNPILLQPSMAYLLWTNLGLLLGLSLRAGRKAVTSP
jgi:O-antigen ligase